MLPRSNPSAGWLIKGKRPSRCKIGNPRPIVRASIPATSAIRVFKSWMLMDVSKRPFALMLKEPGRRVCKLLCISSRDLESRTALRHMPLFPEIQERNFRARVIWSVWPGGNRGTQLPTCKRDASPRICGCDADSGAAIHRVSSKQARPDASAG